MTPHSDLLQLQLLGAPQGLLSINAITSLSLHDIMASALSDGEEVPKLAFKAMLATLPLNKTNRTLLFYHNSRKQDILDINHLFFLHLGQ